MVVQNPPWEPWYVPFLGRGHLNIFKIKKYCSYCCIAGKLPEEFVRASALGGDRGAGCGVCGGEVGGGQRAEPAMFRGAENLIPPDVRTLFS